MIAAGRNQLIFVAVFVGIVGLAGCDLVGCDRGPDVEAIVGELEDSQQSGVVLELRVEESVDSRLLPKVLSTVRTRLDTLEIEDVQVIQRGTGEFVVVLSGIDEDDRERAKRLITEPGKLLVVKVDDDGTADFFHALEEPLGDRLSQRDGEFGFPTVTHSYKEPLRYFFDGRAPEGRSFGYQYHRDPRAGGEPYWETLLVYDSSDLTDEHLVDARVAVDESFNRPFVFIEFDDVGTELLAEMTTNHSDNRLAIMIDDEVVTAPMIREPILEGRVRFTLDASLSHTEAQQQPADLVTMLRGQALSAPIELLAEHRVESTQPNPPHQEGAGGKAQ